MLSGNGIAVTGTREGLTEEQFNTALRCLPIIFNKYGKIFRHGDCIGVDDEVALIVQEHFPDVKVIVHPPENPKYRAFNTYGELLPEAPYLIRDHRMVDIGDFLVGFPKGMGEELRSGTWATIRYARKVCREHMIIYPDGSSALFEA